MRSSQLLLLVFGALHLLTSCNLPLHLLDLEEQLFKAICMGLNDACRDSTYVVVNLLAWGREPYLSHLRPTFLQVERGILRRFPIFTPLLFDEDRLQEAIQSSRNKADMTLHEVALRPVHVPHLARHWWSGVYDLLPQPQDCRLLPPADLPFPLVPGSPQVGLWDPFLLFYFFFI